MEVAGFLIGIVGTIVTIAGLVYSRRAAQGVDQVRRTLATRAHQERVIGKLNTHRRNIMNMVSARQGGLPLEDEIAQALAHIEELGEILSSHRHDLDDLIRRMQSSTGDPLGRAQALLPQLSRVLALADNAMNKQTLANTGV